MVNWAKKWVSCKFARATAGVGGACQTKIIFLFKNPRKWGKYPRDPRNQGKDPRKQGKY